MFVAAVICRVVVLVLLLFHQFKRRMNHIDCLCVCVCCWNYFFESMHAVVLLLLFYISHIRYNKLLFRLLFWLIEIISGYFGSIQGAHGLQKNETSTKQKKYNTNWPTDESKHLYRETQAMTLYYFFFFLWLPLLLSVQNRAKNRRMPTITNSSNTKSTTISINK